MHVRSAARVRQQLVKSWPYLCALAVALHWYALQPWWDDRLFPDSTVHYLSAAAAMMQRGAAYFLDPVSTRVAPWTYVWVALLGGVPSLIKLMNVLCSCLSVVCIYRIGSLLHSFRAGTIAAFSYALSPLIVPWIPQVLSEPPYLFWLTIGLWLLAELEFGSVRAPVMAGLAFGIAVITRPTFVFFLPFMAAAAAWQVARSPPQSRELWLNMRTVSLVALVLPALIIAKNALLFDYPQVAAGTGIATYLGHHPLALGQEPPHFGLNYDDGAASQPAGDPLSLEGDRTLRAVTRVMLGHMGWAELARIYWYKLGALLFFSEFDFEPTLWSIRTLRIIEVVLAVVGLLAVRNSVVGRLLALALVYQLLVHLPVLYNARYAVSALELWLIISSAIGAASLLTPFAARTARNVGLADGPRCVDTPSPISTWGGRTLLVLVIIAACSYGHWGRRHLPRLEPNFEAWPHKVLAAASGADIDRIEGLARSSNGTFLAETDAPSLYYQLPSMQLPPYGNLVWSITLRLQPPAAGHCRQIQLYFAVPGAEFQERNSAVLRAARTDGWYTYHFGVSPNLSHIVPASDGILRIALFCPRGTSVSVGGIALIVPILGQIYNAEVRRLEGK